MTAPPPEVELGVECVGVSWTPPAWLAREVNAVPEVLGAFELGIFSTLVEVHDETVSICQLVRDHLSQA